MWPVLLLFLVSVHLKNTQAGTFKGSCQDDQSTVQNLQYPTVDLAESTVLNYIKQGEHDLVVGGRNTKFVLDQLSSAYSEDDSIIFFTCVSCEISNRILLFKHFEPDRECLLGPQSVEERNLHASNVSPSIADISIDLKGVNKWDKLLQDDQEYELSKIVGETIRKINSATNRYRREDGSLDPGYSYLSHEFPIDMLYKVESNGTRCDVMNSFNMSLFVRNYVMQSKPVLLRGAAKNWSALERWSSEYFKALSRAQATEPKLMTKVVPREAEAQGEFEGSVDAAFWFGNEDGELEKVPAKVQRLLESPEKVMVRPATEYLNFSDLLTVASAPNSTKSYYVEYLSLASHLPSLQGDLGILEAEEVFTSTIGGNIEQTILRNIWIGHGKTVGKVHFDPYDNLMVVLVGSKTFRMFDPTQSRFLYEGHLREATYKLETNGSFTREHLESTSMVNSPIDINRPDLDRYPLFAQAQEITCEVQSGDVLFMPAWWWHEVESQPPKTSAPQSTELDMHTAVNFWYPPIYNKKFPCRDCERTLNLHQYAKLPGFVANLDGR